ncbi:MAG: toll/interleukin-1 receptor domain-containing protein [Hyphomonadaceae bacterium]
MSDVFISYKREDRARVETLYALLLDLDVPAWFDAGIEVGSEWERRIYEEIDAAKAMIVCWTFAAMSSHWVVREAKIGLERSMLVPVMLHPCALAPPFDTLQTANLTTWDGAPDHPEVQRVLGRLALLLGRKNLARNARLRAGGQKEALVGLLRSLLVDRALSGAAPFTYKEAEEALRAAAADEDLRIGEFDQHSLWGALDAIAEQCRRRREPPLDVLVVSKDTGRPGRGYWQKHAFLDGDGDELEKLVFERHLARVRASTWRLDV